MQMTVRADFVARRENLLDQRRMAFGDPSHHEERRRHAGGIEQVEQPSRRRHDARGERVPVGGGQRPADAADVKPLFDVDGEDVHRSRRLAIRLDELGDRVRPCAGRGRRSLRR